MPRKLNFEAINERLLARINSLIPSWLPGGKKQGREWVCGSLAGGKGDSFSVNLETGVWCEFNGGEQKGGDLISLYAAMRGLSQGEAAKELAAEHATEHLPRPEPVAPKASQAPVEVAGASACWTYHDKDGNPVAVISRHDDAGKKRFKQQSLHPQGWVFKAHPEPRPLYQLPKILKAAPEDQITIVEGEKVADFFQRLRKMPVTTWIGGANAVEKTDWSPLYTRTVLIIPDADEAGNKAARKIAKILHDASPDAKIKIIDTTGLPEGWDIADSGWTKYDQFVAEMGPRAQAYAPASVPAVIDPEEVKEVVVEAVDTDVSCPEAKYALWEQIGLPMTTNKRPINNMVTVQCVIDHDPDIKNNVWYDEFYNRIFYNALPLIDESIADLTIRLQSQYGLARMELGTVRTALAHYARKHTRNEPRDWVNSLQWDQKDRLSTFYRDYYGVQDGADEYHKAVSYYFWGGLISRILNPGGQLDCMVVLQGAQGRYKSSSLGIIGGKWYRESCNQVGTKDFLESLPGVLLMEIGELASFRKAETESIKNMLSTRIDHYRPSYGYNTVDFPRRCVFVGTTNEDQYIADQTGGRRFYPVSISKANIKALSDDRPQLFAQARHLYQTTPTFWDVPTHLAEVHQEERRVSDPWEEIIEKYLSFQRNNEPVFTIKVATDALQLRPNEINRLAQNRICNCLKKIGYKCTVVKNESRKSQKAWVKMPVSPVLEVDKVVSVDKNEL